MSPHPIATTSLHHHHHHNFHLHSPNLNAQTTLNSSANISSNNLYINNLENILLADMNHNTNIGLNHSNINNNNNNNDVFLNRKDLNSQSSFLSDSLIIECSSNNHNNSSK